MLVLSVLLALLIVLLTIPLTIVFSIHRNSVTRGRIRFGWLFGLVHFQLTLPHDSGDKSKTGPIPTSEKKRKIGTSKLRKEKRNMQGLFALLREPIFRQRVMQFIRDALAATHAEDLFFRLRIGTGDPADTGRLWAIIGPLAGLLRSIKTIDAYIEPEFMEPLLEIKTHGRFRLFPIQFLYLLIHFLLSLATLVSRFRWRVKGA